MKKWLVWIWIPVLLVGCSQASASEATRVEVPVESDKDVLIAEGVVEPARWSMLFFEMGGEVTQVLIQEGDRVMAGALLVRLDMTKLSLALQSAEQDVVAQEAALQLLLDGSPERAVARADKANADQIAQARVVLVIKQLQLEKAQAEDPGIAVAAAQARVDQLQFQVVQARAQSPDPAVAAAQVELERAQIALDDTQDEYNKALDRPWEDQQIRDGWAKQLEQVQLNYQAAQANLESVLNARQAHQAWLNVLGAQIREAQIQLEQATVAQETYPITIEMLKAEVQAAELRLEALQVWENPYLDPPLEQAVVQARAMLEKARLAVETIRAQMRDAELEAPFDGVIVDLEVRGGDQVQPGQVVVTLATLDRLQVRTTDLTELDVARVAVGQAAEIKVDALPELGWQATVIEVALRGQDRLGDVVYDVTLDLVGEESLALLRWGMTTMVEIDLR